MRRISLRRRTRVFAKLRTRVNVHEAAKDFAAGKLRNQPAARSRATGAISMSAPRSKRCEASVCNPWAFRGTADRDGLKPGALEQYRTRGGEDLGIFAAHHARQRHRALRVGNHQVVGRERALHAVQGAKLFAGYAPCAR